MAIGSLGTDILGGSNGPLASFGGGVIFSDAVFYAAIEAMARKGERDAHDFFRNLLIGLGSSALTSMVVSPLVSSSLPGATAPQQRRAGQALADSTVPVSRTISTSSY